MNALYRMGFAACAMMSVAVAGCAVDSEVRSGPADDTVDVPEALDADANGLDITDHGVMPKTGCIATVGYDCNNIAQGSDISQADLVCMTRCGNRPMHCVISYRSGAPSACTTAGPNGGDGLSYCMEVGVCPLQCFVGTCVPGYRP